MTSTRFERALILAPQGRDASVAQAMLAEAGLPGEIVATVLDLVDQLRLGAGFAIITEEALAGTDLHALSDWLDEQPEWSDFPFVLLTRRGGGLERNPEAEPLSRSARQCHVPRTPFPSDHFRQPRPVGAARPPTPI